MFWCVGWYSESTTSVDSYWQILSNGNSTYRIVSISGNKYVAANKSGAANTTLRTYSGAADEQWVFETVWPGYWYLDQRTPDFQLLHYGIINMNSSDVEKVNCAGYAMRVKDYITGATIGIVNQTNVNTAATQVQKYFSGRLSGGRTIRLLASGLTESQAKAALSADEYLVAFRIRTSTTPSWDFHFHIMTADKGWADKVGWDPPRSSPSTNWNTYDSATRYFAVTKTSRDDIASRIWQ